MIGIIGETTQWPALIVTKFCTRSARFVISADVENAVGVRLRSRLHRNRPFHSESDAGPNIRAKLIEELTVSPRSAHRCTAT